MRRSADRRYIASTRLGGLDWFEADFVGDVVELIAADLFELFAAGLELFVDLNGLLGHHLMRFLRAADQRKVRPGRQPFMTVGIQSDTKHHCLAFSLFGRVRHAGKIEPANPTVKQRASQVIHQTHEQNHFAARVHNGK